LAQGDKLLSLAYENIKQKNGEVTLGNLYAFFGLPAESIKDVDALRKRIYTQVRDEIRAAKEEKRREEQEQEAAREAHIKAEWPRFEADLNEAQSAAYEGTGGYSSEDLKYLGMIAYRAHVMSRWRPSTYLTHVELMLNSLPKNVSAQDRAMLAQNASDVHDIPSLIIFYAVICPIAQKAYEGTNTYDINNTYTPRMGGADPWYEEMRERDEAASYRRRSWLLD